MKTQTLMKWTLLGLTALNVLKMSAYAQTPGEGGIDVGNGGSGVRCGRGSRATISFLDLWEAEHTPPTHAVTRTPIPEGQQVEAIADRLEDIWPDYARSFRTVVAYLRMIRANLDSTVAAPLPTDLGFSLNGQTCVRLPIATFVQGTGGFPNRLFLAQSYSQLSATDQAALWVHEAIYYIDRALGNTTTSEHARLVVARLFSQQSLTPENLVPAGTFPPIRLPGTRMVHLPGETVDSFWHRARCRDRRRRNVPCRAVLENPIPATADDIEGTWKVDDSFFDRYFVTEEIHQEYWNFTQVTRGQLQFASLRLQGGWGVFTMDVQLPIPIDHADPLANLSLSFDYHRVFGRNFAVDELAVATRHMSLLQPSLETGTLREHDWRGWQTGSADARGIQNCVILDTENQFMICLNDSRIGFLVLRRQ